MRVVVTGAAGFIGSHVCERLLDRGDHVLGADAVCHLAGAPGVRSADEEVFEIGNVAATRAVVWAAARARVPRVVHASSSSVYAPARAPVREDARLAPLSPYGHSKLRAERV